MKIGIKLVASEEKEFILLNDESKLMERLLQNKQQLSASKANKKK